MMNDGLNENYAELANAMVLQACVDYQNNLGQSAKEILRREEIKDFFYSDLFGLITQINPDELIHRLEHGSKVNFEG